MFVDFQCCIGVMFNSLTDKSISLSKYYKEYFKNEEMEDLFEGFLRLLLVSEELNKRLNNRIFSYTLIFNIYYKRIQSFTEKEKDFVLNVIPADPQILVSFLFSLFKKNNF